MNTVLQLAMHAGLEHLLKCMYITLQAVECKVKVSATGFSTDTIEKVTLQVAQSLTLNPKLAIEPAGETVQVQSSAVSQIESSIITVGEVIGKDAVQELPLNGRHFLDLRC